MPITMKERTERAKRHQKAISDARPDKRRKLALSPSVITKHRKELLDEQLGLCAICDKVVMNSKLNHLDHCHESGEIRGVLCHNCNVGLGHFRDSPELLVRAINYVNKFRCVEVQLQTAYWVNQQNIKVTAVTTEFPQQSMNYDGVMSNEEFDKLPGKEKIEYLRSQENKKSWWKDLKDVITFDKII